MDGSLGKGRPVNWDRSLLAALTALADKPHPPAGLVHFRQPEAAKLGAYHRPPNTMSNTTPVPVGVQIGQERIDIIQVDRLGQQLGLADQTTRAPPPSRAQMARDIEGLRSEPR